MASIWKKPIRSMAALLLCTLLWIGLGGNAFADYDGYVQPSSALLLDPDTGETLYEKSADDRVWPASTTKILTALVVLDETPDVNALVNVDGAALSGIYEGDDSTLVPMLKAGEQLTVEQLLYGLMLVSGNDCASALAYHVAGGTEAFAALMNEKAVSLGMTASHFTNPHGVQNDNHYSTARDMAKLAKAAMDTPAFMAIVSTAHYTIPATNMAEARTLDTSNRFLLEKDDIPGTACAWVTGIKTGYTPAAGGCLVTGAERNGKRLLCLVYGDASENQRDRWFLTKDLLAYGFGAVSPAMDEHTASEAAITADLLSSGASDLESPSRIRPVLLTVLGVLLLVLAAGMLILTVLRVHNARVHYKRKFNRSRAIRAAVPTLALAVILAVPMVLCLRAGGKSRQALTAYREALEANQIAQTEAEAKLASRSRFQPIRAAQGESISPLADISGLRTTADPARWGVRWDILTGSGVVLSYERIPGISFDGGDYFALPGVASFRGGNYRDGGSYGNIPTGAGLVSTKWTASTGSLAGSQSGAWTGSGWTGQPLIVHWDAATRAIMNLNADKKAKEDLTEVVYATLDGHVYFLDLDDGSYTRPPLDLGMPFKGAGALDPRGYPLLYVGSGDETSDGRRPRMFIVSLIDGTVLYEGGHDDGDSLRTDHDRWCAFDSSPLVDAETDTLIWPGESGILYTMRLNTAYDANAGTISIAPEEPIRTRYDTDRSGADRYWYGYEASAVIVDRCLYISENGGMFFCVDLDTMELLWAQDTRDDSNSTPVYEPDGDAHGYLYTAPSLHWTAGSDRSGETAIYKLDAITGEIVWSRTYDCWTVDGVSGGVQSSPVLGREGSAIDGLVIYGISRTPDMGTGLLVALDTRTGSEVWRLAMDYYAWSSPLALYDYSGNARILLCDSEGTAHLIDGATGQILSTAGLGSLVEASPAAFGDTAVVGTRGQQICALRIS